MTLRDAQIDPRKSYYDKLAQVESGGNPNAKSISSTAAGIYQFIEGTWTGLVDKYKLGFELEDRFDPIKSKIVLNKLTDENERYLKRRLGRTPTDDELYMAHFLGMGGAAKFYEALREDSSTPVVSVIGERAYKSNQPVFKNRQTLGDVAQWAKEKMNMPISGIERSNQTEFGIIPFHSSFEEPTTAIDNSSEGAKLIFQENEEERTASENLDREERKEKVFEQYRRVPQEQLVQAPQYQQQDVLQTYAEIDQFVSNPIMQQGGQIPTSSLGQYQYPNQVVNVPTPNGTITMKGVNYPVLAISQETGEQKVMLPEKEYFFKNTQNVVEVPQK